MTNICLIGRAGAGKSTVADLLINRTDLGYEKLSFAAPLKTGCATQTDRAILQRVGHGVRELFPDFWVNLAVAELGKRQDRSEDPVVVDDCRYLNEYYALLDAGFTFIRVTAPQPVRITRLEANGKLTDVEQLRHPSELQLDDVMVDHCITNGTDDVADVEHQLVRILNLIGR